DRAFDGAEKILATVLHKGAFWKRHGTDEFNPRQKDMLNRLLDGFTGKLTSTKWAKIEKCSQDTAYRDITDLLERHILEKDAGGGLGFTAHAARHQRTQQGAHGDAAAGESQGREQARRGLVEMRQQVGRRGTTGVPAVLEGDAADLGKEPAQLMLGPAEEER